jgi:hypothetical protein
MMDDGFETTTSAEAHNKSVQKVLERDRGILFELLGEPLGVREAVRLRESTLLLRGDHVVATVACVSRSKKTKK